MADENSTPTPNKSTTSSLNLTPPKGGWPQSVQSDDSDPDIDISLVSTEAEITQDSGVELEFVCELEFKEFEFEFSRGWGSLQEMIHEYYTNIRGMSIAFFRLFEVNEFFLVILDCQQRMASEQYLLLDILNGISERLKGLKYFKQISEHLNEQKGMIKKLQMEVLLCKRQQILADIRLKVLQKGMESIEKKMAEEIYDSD